MSTPYPNIFDAWQQQLQRFTHAVLNSQPQPMEVKRQYLPLFQQCLDNAQYRARFSPVAQQYIERHFPDVSEEAQSAAAALLHRKIQAQQWQAEPTTTTHATALPHAIHLLLAELLNSSQQSDIDSGQSLSGPQLKPIPQLLLPLLLQHHEKLMLLLKPQLTKAKRHRKKHDLEADLDNDKETSLTSELGDKLEAFAALLLGLLCLFCSSEQDTTLAQQPSPSHAQRPSPSHTQRPSPSHAQQPSPSHAQPRTICPRPSPLTRRR